MPQGPPVWVRKRCELCGADIREGRFEAIAGVRTCVRCQRRIEETPRGVEDSHGRGQPEGWGAQEAPPPEAGSLRVEESRVVVGQWSQGIVELAATGAEFRNLLDTGETLQARALVRSLPVEAQAALVTLDEDPEEALSLTGMEDSGAPAYSAAVVEFLPSEVLAGLIAYRTDERKFNSRLMQAMSPQAFKRTIEETLDPVDNTELRTRVSWEWLQALAALDDFNRRAELIRSVDPAIWEEALLDRLKHIDMHAVVGMSGHPISLFRLFSEEAGEGVRLGSLVDDAETGEVLDAVFEAAPELLRRIVRGAWERQD